MKICTSLIRGSLVLLAVLQLSNQALAIESPEIVGGCALSLAESLKEFSQARSRRSFFEDPEMPRSLASISTELHLLLIRQHLARTSHLNISVRINGQDDFEKICSTLQQASLSGKCLYAEREGLMLLRLQIENKETYNELLRFVGAIDDRVENVHLSFVKVD